MKNESATASSDKKRDDSRISLLKLELISGSKSNRCITNAIVVGGFTHHLKIIKIRNSMSAIWLSLNLPLPNHESVESLIIADSLNFMAI
mmetsp:Transcript_19550/g.33600  ORF Transcript_19550/g.33600 Transcript_19550/m.33600 type:complete len:90 (-) Transcript_19550:455-724(-)